MSSEGEDGFVNDSEPTWGKAILCASLWQMFPAAWLMLDAWDSPSTQTLFLRATVFFVIPVLSGLIHRSWQIGIAALLLPIFAIGVMMTIYMLLMPTGKW